MNKKKTLREKVITNTREPRKKPNEWKLHLMNAGNKKKQNHRKALNEN